MRQPLVKERQDLKCSVVARQALHAVLAKLKSPMLLSLGYLIGWYWRV